MLRLDYKKIFQIIFYNCYKKVLNTKEIYFYYKNIFAKKYKCVKKALIKIIGFKLLL